MNVRVRIVAYWHCVLCRCACGPLACDGYAAAPSSGAYSPSACASPLPSAGGSASSSSAPPPPLSLPPALLPPQRRHARTPMMIAAAALSAAIMTFTLTPAACQPQPSSLSGGRRAGASSHAVTCAKMAARAATTCATRRRKAASKSMDKRTTRHAACIASRVTRLRRVVAARRVRPRVVARAVHPQHGRVIAGRCADARSAPRIHTAVHVQHARRAGG
jgi:hypothetical protein